MEFLADHHIKSAISKGLIKRGYKVLTLTDVGLSEADDKDIIKFANIKKLVIITNDSDFKKIIEKENVEHSGIIFITKQWIDVGIAIRKISNIADATDPENIANQLWYVG